jgi:hypothetical protein
VGLVACCQDSARDQDLVAGVEKTDLLIVQGRSDYCLLVHHWPCSLIKQDAFYSRKSANYNKKGRESWKWDEIQENSYLFAHRAAIK